MTDHYVFETAGTGRLPGLPDRFVGRDGYLAAHATLLETLDVERVALDDVIPLPDGRVATLIRFVIRAVPAARNYSRRPWPPC